MLYWSTWTFKFRNFLKCSYLHAFCSNNKSDEIKNYDWWMSVGSRGLIQRFNPGKHFYCECILDRGIHKTSFAFSYITRMCRSCLVSFKWSMKQVSALLSCTILNFEFNTSYSTFYNLPLVLPDLLCFPFFISPVHYLLLFACCQNSNSLFTDQGKCHAWIKTNIIMQRQRCTHGYHKTSSTEILLGIALH